jgi:hypothetical protein
LVHFEIVRGGVGHPWKILEAIVRVDVLSAAEGRAKNLSFFGTAAIAHNVQKAARFL